MDSEYYLQIHHRTVPPCGSPVPSSLADAVDGYILDHTPLNPQQTANLVLSIRLYRVKKPDNIGRDHATAAAFEKGHKKKSRKGGSKRQARILRED